MHPFLALAVLSAYGWCSLSFLPFLLALSGGFVLLYVLAGSLLGGPPMSTRRKLMAATWAPPSEGTIFGVITINAEPLMDYLEKLAARGTKISVTIAVVRAIALALRESPTLNCRLAFGRFLPRSSIDVSCLVALDDGKDLANAKIASADRKQLSDIAAELKAKADKLRAHKDEDYEKTKLSLAMLPVCVLTPLVHTIGWLSGALGLNIPALGVRPYPFGSCLVTSVGMLGIEQAFVPFTPFARVPLLMAVGEVSKRAVVGANDQISVQRQFTLTGTLDHRFIDGSDAARFSKKLRYLLENPQLLEGEAADSDSKQRK